MAEKKEVKEKEEEEMEMDLEDLENVSGGFSLKDVSRVKPTELSQDTINRI